MSAMKYRMQHLDISAEVIFGRPAFDLVQKTPQLLAAICDSVRPQFDVKAQDITALPGTSGAETGFSISLFNGQGTLTVSMEKLGARFNNMRGDGDLQLAKDVMKRAYSSVGGLSEHGVGAVGLDLGLHMALEKGGDGADALFDGIKKDAANRYDKLQGGRVRVHSNDTIDNGEEGWRCIFVLERSLREDSDAFLSARGVYLGNGAIKAPEAIVAHFEALTNEYIGCFGLQAE